MAVSKSFAYRIPKAELHLHIEGTLEPELLFKLAKRNKVRVVYSSVSALKKAYNFKNLQEFLDLYYAGCAVLLKEQDFYDLTFAYFKKVKSQGVMHAEIFFDPQTHTARGVSFKTAIKGILRACKKAQKSFGISSKLILCFLRHLDEKDALETLKEALPYRKFICAVGLDSSEKGNPPSKFKRVFAKARALGFKTVAHAGEEGPARYVYEALDMLKVSRIDHGNHALDDKKLVSRLAKEKIPLTICPLSNLRLCVVTDLKQHPLVRMLANGLNVTINSDDPAYFGGYIGDNYYAISKALHLTHEQLVLISRNSFESSFLSKKEKVKHRRRLDGFMK